MLSAEIYVASKLMLLLVWFFFLYVKTFSYLSSSKREKTLGERDSQRLPIMKDSFYSVFQIFLYQNHAIL